VKSYENLLSLCRKRKSFSSFSPLGVYISIPLPVFIFLRESKNKIE
jgi:hypothetical protein